MFTDLGLLSSNATKITVQKTVNDVHMHIICIMNRCKNKKIHFNCTVGPGRNNRPDYNMYSRDCVPLLYIYYDSFNTH